MTQITTEPKGNGKKKETAIEKAIFPTDDAGWEAEGFRLVNPAVYFYKPSVIVEDRVVRHKLTGIVLTRANRAYTERDRERDDREGKKRKGSQHFFLVAVTRVCTLYDHEKRAIEAPPGTIAWVDQRFNLAPLDAMVPKLDPNTGRPTRVTEVGIEPIEKVSTRAGNNVWKFRLRAKEHEAAKAGVPLLSPIEASSMVQTAESYAAQRDLNEQEPDENGEVYNDPI